MSETNEEHQETEETLRRVRPQEPSAEVKARVLGAARAAWHPDRRRSHGGFPSEDWPHPRQPRC